MSAKARGDERVMAQDPRSVDPERRHVHWEGIYEAKAPGDVSWYQATPQVSLELIAATGLDRGASIIDVGGGASTLVDHLLDLGYGAVTVLDVAEASLAAARDRLGDRAAWVEWIAADITSWRPEKRFDLWHDRAVFHFLTAAEDREAYRATLERAVGPGGHAVIATFSLEAPLKCSGLPVVRYSAESLADEIGPGFELTETRREDHVTPWGDTQKFSYASLRRR